MLKVTGLLISQDPCLFFKGALSVLPLRILRTTRCSVDLIRLSPLVLAIWSVQSDCIFPL